METIILFAPLVGALNGLLSGVNAPKKSGSESAEQYAHRVAEEAYLFAEAMLQQRVKPTSVP